MSQIYVPSSGGGGGGTITSVLATSGSKAVTIGTVVTIYSPPYSDVSSPALLSSNNGYFCITSGTYTLPVSAGLSNGDLVEIVALTTGVVIQASSGQTISIANNSTTVAGAATSGNGGDVLAMRFRVADSTWWSQTGTPDWILS